MNRVTFRVVGLVQGVGFRAYAQRQAVALGVRGWVRNDADGSVVGEAEADENAIAAFANALKRGPSQSRVDRVSVESSPQVAPLVGFEVRR